MAECEKPYKKVDDCLAARMIRFVNGMNSLARREAICRAKEVGRQMLDLPRLFKCLRMGDDSRYYCGGNI